MIGRGEKTLSPRLQRLILCHILKAESIRIQWTGVSDSCDWISGFGSEPRRLRSVPISQNIAVIPDTWRTAALRFSHLTDNSGPCVERSQEAQLFPRPREVKGRLLLLLLLGDTRAAGSERRRGLE